jgi:hypothetical protein
LRLGKAELTRQFVDASRLAQLRLTQAQLAVLLAQLLNDLLFALHAVAALNGVEVLQAVDHDQGKEHSRGG